MSNGSVSDGPCLGFATRAVHAGAAPHAGTGARVTPIFLTNGFVFEDQAHGADIFALRKPGFSYTRGANPTTATLERRVADLEGGVAAIAVSSGQSALLLILMTLCESGDDYVAATQSFGGSRALMNRLAKRLKIGVRWVDGRDHAAVAAAVGPRTKGIMVESVVNPTGEVMDLTALAAIAKSHRLPLVVDNTLATPALLRPIEHGADIVWHSASKFMNASGTAIGGVIVDAGRFDWAGDARFALISEPWDDYDGLVIPQAYPATAFATACRLIGLRELGPGLSPMNAFLILTGIETLHLRMPRHCDNAMRIASYLVDHPSIAVVSYPGLASHANHAVAARLCPDGVGSIFMATLKGGGEAASRALSRFKLFSHLVNLGETRSLVAHPASTTHRQLTPDERKALGISDGTLRFSIGLENAEDLISDLDHAFAETLSG